MNAEMRRCEDRWSRWAILLVGTLALLMLGLSKPHAQEQIDPRTGHLLLTVTDVAVPVEPITLTLRRALTSRERPQGLLGGRWKTNWESRVVSTPTALVIDEIPYPVAFTRAGSTREHHAVAGERLVVQGDGRFVRTTTTGTTETFDIQGRLVERDYLNGNKALVRYGRDGHVARIDGPRGSFIQFNADTQRRVTRVAMSSGDTVRYGYMGDDLTEVQVNGGPLLRYAYDVRGALNRIDDPQSGAVELAYDPSLRVISRRWADGAQERYEYNDAAREQRRIDPTGAVTVTRWSADQRRAELIEPRGGKIEMAFDSGGRLESITGPTAETTKFTYDPLGRTTALQDQRGQSTRFDFLGVTSFVKNVTQADGTRQSLTYDAQNNLTEITLGTRTVAAFAYKPDGNLSAVKVIGLPQQKLSYSAQARIQTLTNPSGDRVQIGYDARGNPVSAVDPLGGKWTWQSDSQGRIVSETDPIGATTRYEYDASGRLIRMINAQNTATHYAYDVRGRLIAETNPAGQVQRYEYDRAGRLAKRTDKNGSESFRYNTAGDLIERTDTLGRNVQIERDILGHVTQERWSNGLQLRYRYDVHGELVGIEDSEGGKVDLQHDDRHRISAARDAAGATIQFKYDDLGNVIEQHNARGQVKQFAYTANGMLANVRDASGNSAQYRYDAADRLIEIVRPSGGRSRFSYNGLGQLTRNVDPLDNERRYEYDAAAHLVSSADAAGRVTRYSYDASGRLTEKRFSSDSRVTFKYDNVGNLLAADDGVFPVRYQHDRAGRVTRVEYPAIGKAVGYEYDTAGLRTRLVQPDGSAIRYEYDQHKELAAIITPDGKRIALAYDARQRLRSIQYPNGITGRWEYDAAGRLTSLGYVNRSGKALETWTYRYDSDGNLIEQKDGEGHSTAFTYDAANQLIEVKASAGSTRYQYAPGGNRTTSEERAALTQYRHDSANRVIEAGPDKLNYDANGNLVRREGPRGVTSYEYDARDHLMKVQGPDGNLASFGYAPTGQRVWKRDAGGMTQYVYDDLDLIQELDDKGNPKAIYVHGPVIDQPLVMLRGGDSFYYHADRMGSVRFLTDANGNIAASYDYDAFGKLASKGAVTNAFSFTGREWDAGTGLYYYRARYYDPGLGQFLSPDPIAASLTEPLELNPYRYARNNPVRFVDPLGLTSHNTYVDLERQRDALRVRLQEEQALGGPNVDSIKAEIARANRQLMNLDKAGLQTGATVTAEEAQELLAHPPRSMDITQKIRVRPPPSYPPRASSPVPPEPPGLVGKFVEKVKGFFGGGTVAEEETAAISAESAITGKFPRPNIKNVLIIIVPALLAAGASAAQAEPGKRLEAAGGSLGDSAGGLWESGKTMGKCAAVGAVIGGCFGGPPGALVGARIGAQVPLVIDAGKVIIAGAKAASDSLQPYVDKLKQLYPEPLPPGQEPPKTPGLVGSVTGGLPGAPFDPRTAPRLPQATPEQIAAAQGLAGQAGGGVPLFVPPGIPKGGKKGVKQGAYQDPPIDVTEGPRDKPPVYVDTCPKVDKAGKVLEWVPCPAGVFPGTPLPATATDQQPLWCWSDQSQTYYQVPMYPCPPTKTVPTGPPPSGGQVPSPPGGLIPGMPIPPSRPGSTLPGVIAGTGVVTVPPRSPPGSVPQPPGNQPPTGGGTGGGTSPPKAPPPVAQGPGNTTAPPASGGQCNQPLCYQPGQKECEKGPLPNEAGWLRACSANMLLRCNQGEAGGTGGWCVHKGADPSCAARAQRVCGERIQIQ